MESPQFQSPKDDSLSEGTSEINQQEREEETDKTPNSRSASECELGRVKIEEDVDLVPEIGTEFESEEQAYKCYSRYAILEGFSIRKDFVNKSRIDGSVVSRRYTCYRQGYRSNKETISTISKKPRSETRTGCLAHLTIARQPNAKFRVTHFETTHNHEFVTPSTAHLLPSQKRLTFARAVEADCEGIDRGLPKLGLGFDSEDSAYEFYNAYARKIGFSVRKDYVNRSKIDGGVVSRRFTCFREGFRQKDKRDMNVKRPRIETRIGCLAQLVVSRQPDGKYRVSHFEEKHNHELVAPCRVHMLRSQKRLVASQVEGNLMVPLKIRECGDMSFDCIDYGRKLSSKGAMEMREGEAEKLLQYFHNKRVKNPSFVYSVQPDVDDKMTNVFWADSKMVVDYSDYGDVVCFDTTCKLHKDCRPFVLFIGVNHHKQMVIFGAALLNDETVESYKWLFRTFIEAMSGKKPKTILTDHDEVLTEAIDSVLLGTNHRICAWHVYQTALKQLDYMFTGSCSFVNDLNGCFFGHEEADGFNNAWKAMLKRHELLENDHLCAIYEDREKWAIPYRRQIFCADIESALRGGSFTTNLRKYLNLGSDLTPLLKHLSKIVSDLHYKELEANYDMSQRPPKLMGDVILLKHARNVYTPAIFGLLQQEYEICLNMVVNKCTHNRELFEYRVSIYGQRKEYTVTFNSTDESVACNCMKFESVGVLCSHALKVLDYRNLKFVPNRYILKRWTKDARV